MESREDFVDHPFEPPADPFEVAIARIGAEILGIDRLGRSDCFYDFGGTSLQAIRICTRIELELGCHAEPGWLLASDVMADFASQLESNKELASE